VYGVCVYVACMMCAMGMMCVCVWCVWMCVVGMVCVCVVCVWMCVLCMCVVCVDVCVDVCVHARMHAREVTLKSKLSPSLGTSRIPTSSEEQGKYKILRRCKIQLVPGLAITHNEHNPRRLTQRWTTATHTHNYRWLIHQ